MVEVERNGVMVLVPGGWRVPDALPLLEHLEQGRQAVAHSLTPAGDQGVGEVMMPLLLTTQVPATQGMGDGSVQSFFTAMASEYRRHLRDVPLDILRAAADACVRESEFFPAVAAFLRHARPELEKRQRQAERIGLMIEARNRPQPKPREKTARELETREERLRNGIATCRRFGRIETAMAWEHELAALEGREVEEWARGYTQPEPPPKRETPPHVGTFKSSGVSAAALKRSLARQHRERGNTAYAEKLEQEADALAPAPTPTLTDEPPPPDDIPEGDSQEQEP